MRLPDLEARIGHQFANQGLLERALTHPSFQDSGNGDNQRMEFLGDRVLGLVIAEVLFELDPEAEEGTLAQRLNALVRKETCASVAEAIDLGASLRLGRSEMLSGGRRKLAALGDAMEAVIAAVYLDAGYDAARQVIRTLWQGEIAQVDDAPVDPKSALQHLAQARGQRPPVYRELERRGPPHDPVFTVEAVLETGEVHVGTAGSKRAAQQRAAAGLLDMLETGSE